MTIIRAVVGFAVAWLVSFSLSAGFYTQQVLAGYGDLGLDVSAKTAWTTFTENFAGLLTGYESASWGQILAVALMVAFAVAFAVKRIVRPLAAVAYPIAGALGVASVILIIESVFDNAGVFGGARGAFGVALQALAGLAGGVAFAATLSVGRR